MEGSQTARASPAAPFLLTQFPVGSMHYCFLLSHLQHPDRKKDFSPCFADCRGHSLLPGGWSCAGKGHPITRVCSAPVPRARTCGESGASTASAAPSSTPEQLHQHFQNSSLLKNKEPLGCPGCWNHQQGQGKPGPMSPVELSQNYSGQISTNTRAYSSTFPAKPLCPKFLWLSLACSTSPKTPFDVHSCLPLLESACQKISQKKLVHTNKALQ